MNTNTSLNGARVLVLGGSGQLGRLIASQIVERGARVAIAGTDSARLNEAAAAIGSNPLTIEFDFRRSDEFSSIIDQVVEEMGGIDGVVNAAGVVGFGALIDTPDEVIESLVAIDFVGPLTFMKAAVPYLTNGFWVNITGVVAEQPMGGLAAYSAVKAGLSAATRAVSRELRRSGITVIDVRPPHTETGLANRPISGSAPPMPPGLEPAIVAARIVAAIESNESEVGAAAFS
jgi:NAD(P)-dependent dehydrogenase (short-subunit alcohol dehydrogenase family)